MSELEKSLTIETGIENKSGLFAIFEDNSPKNRDVDVRFPKGQVLRFRNYHNLQELREIQASVKIEAEMNYKAAQSGFGTFGKYAGLDHADFAAASALNCLCLGQVVDGVADGSSKLDDWLDAALLNPTLFAWVIRNVDLQMFGLQNHLLMEDLDEAKKE
jgi:hypothetical protein